MTPERFVHLAEAYGADLRRWPAAERSGAQTLIARGDACVLDALHQARWLDSRLDSHQALLADPLLKTRIATSALAEPRPSWWSRHAEWWSRLGFLGAGLAGIAAGMLVMSLQLPLADSSEVLPSVFDHGDIEWILGVDAEEDQP
ncbi:hypothetical protein ACIPL1_22235 [Pseudomonas sp. NPDC090202]|uniref:hypothetical protein n=1 Tax=unclassified Pseudomonas TaxID=196821 RepID=UPI0037F1993D